MISFQKVMFYLKNHLILIIKLVKVLVRKQADKINEKN